VDVVDTGTDGVRVLRLLKDVEELEVALGRLDRDDVGVEAGNVLKDVVLSKRSAYMDLSSQMWGRTHKVRVAEVAVGLSVVFDTGSGELERIDGPAEVTVPVDAAERKTFTDGGLIDLDGKDASVGEVDDLVAESERKLLALELAANIGTGERPVEDGDGASQHALDGLLGERLGV
jgi:hypothetical protein